jgi:predicted AAA+ superfamily ATPase
MITREVLPKILHWVGKEKILILKGARQVGKTTLLNEVVAEIKKKDPTAEVVFLRADDTSDAAYLRSTAILEEYLKRNHGFPNRFVTVCIDEFQNIPDAGTFLKTFFDAHKGKLQFIVSGSSSLEITKNTEFLTGRSIDFDIPRITFREYFNYENNSTVAAIPLSDFESLKLFYETYTDPIDLRFGTYLTYGGYPEVITTAGHEDKITILESIAKTYVEKDVAGFLRIENITGFNYLVRILSAQIGSLVNLSEISITTGLARNTAEKYLEVLVGTYVFHVVHPFFRNIRSELSKMPKIYALDIGMRNYFTRSFDTDGKSDGHRIENFAYLELLNRFKKEYVHFYRTTGGAEIDFVVELPNNSVLLAEVKYRQKPSLPVAMRNFEKRYPEVVSEKIILTKNVIRKDPDGTIFLPVNLLPFVDLTS